jgi:hypothetical protein
MKKFICTTTINPPTEAISKFDSMKDWTLVVAGDTITPPDYRLGKGVYLSPKEQEQFDKPLSDALGWRCIERRNMAIAWAYHQGADVLAIVDDDNIPLPGWGEHLSIGRTVEVNYYETRLECFDPMGATNYPHLWHRGFPLQYLRNRDYSQKTRRKVHVDIQADFWNGDPDIDAVCRMEHGPECTFNPNDFPIASNALSPFNSQNTFISRAVAKDYFLPQGIGRISDIWAAYYVTAKHYQAVYCQASVYQKRNVHDLTTDLRNELYGYEKTLDVARDLKQDPERLLKYYPAQAQKAWRAYRNLLARCNLD